MGSITFEVDAGRKLVVDPIEHSAIHSRENARFKLIRSLSGSRGVKKHGLALLAGRRLIAECLRERLELAVALVESGRPEDARADDEAIVPAGLDPPRYVFAPELFRELDFLGAGSPLLLVRPREPAKWSDLSDGSDVSGDLGGLSVILPLSDPDNLGAALRSCAAFGVSRAILPAEAAHPFHARSLRSSAGQALRLPIITAPPLRELLNFWRGGATNARGARGLPELPELLGLDMNGDELSSLSARGEPGEGNGADSAKDMAVLVGEEGTGLPDEIPGRRVRIAMRSDVESLNAGVALGIVLYHLRRI